MKKLFLVVILLTSINVLQAQNIIFHLTTGSTKTIEAASIDYIGFAGITEDGSSTPFTDIYYTNGSRQRLKMESIEYVEYEVIDEEAPDSTFTEWESYSPSLSYNFKEEYPDFKEPTKNLPYSYSNLDYVVSDRWWSVFVGKNANSKVTETGVKNMLERLNTDFAYLRDVMGWPPDLAPQKGYRSAVFVYGSGLSTDNASNTDEGGWQSWITVNNTSYPMILISYYPIYCYDPACSYSDITYQTDAVVHEGIHTVFSSLPGGKNAAWFNEGCNCWLQATMELDRSGTTNYNSLSFGWLASGSVIAPFIPIESYGGWLTDGTFGGPNIQGMGSNTRYLLGGIQYSEIFPTFLGEYLGYNTMPWIWQNCTTRILEGLAKGLGAAQVKRIIQEYRARLCLSDFGRYEQAVQKVYKTYMNYNIYAENENDNTTPNWKATPYTPTTKDEEGYLVPDEATLPGWTGANIIPIKVNSTAKTVTVTFDPKSTTKNMSCQLCYRTAAGKTIYGLPFYEGDYTIGLEEDKPANGIVFAVICNLNYTYSNSIRSKHYPYRLKLGNGATGTASVYGDWYDWK